MNLFKKTTATIALVALVSGIFSTGVSAASSTQIEAANALAAKGYIVNHSDNIAAYNLDQNVLRQEIAAVARGIAGLEKKSTCDNIFSDVSATTPNTWACYSVEALADADLIAKNDKFNPENEISKAEAVGMMVKAVFGDEYSYDSNSSASWQEQVVNFAVSKGVVASFTNYDDAATRGFVFEAGYEAMNANTEVVVDETCDEFMAALGLCDVTTDTTTDTTETTTTDTTTDTPVVVSGDNVVSIELSPETPVAADLPKGADGVLTLKLDVTAGAEDVSVTEFNFERTGFGEVAADKVSLFANGTRLTKSKTFNSDDEANVSVSPALVVMAGETVTVDVRVDTSTTEIGEFSIKLVNISASTDVEMNEIVSNTFDVKEVAATILEFNTGSVNSQVTAGETDAEIVEFDLKNNGNVSNSDITVSSITLKEIGTVDQESDLANLKLVMNGDVIATVDSMSNKYLTFNLDTPVVINDGKSETFTVTADIIGGADKNIKFILDTDGDIVATASKYTAVNVVSQFAGQEVSIQAGELTIYAIDAENDKIRDDKDDVVLGTIKVVNVAGEDLSIKNLGIQLVTTNSGVAEVLENVKAEINGNSYDLYAPSTISDPKDVVYSDTDLDIALPQGTTMITIIADTLDNLTDGETITMSLNVDDNQFYVEELNDDNQVTDITPSVLSFDSVEVKQPKATVSKTPLADVAVVKGTSDITALQFDVEANETSALTIDKINVLVGTGGTASGGAVKDFVSEVKLYKGSVSEVNKLDSISGNKLGSNGEASFDGFEVTIDADATETFIVVVSTVDSAAVVDGEIVVSYDSINVEDDENDTVTVVNTANSFSGKTITLRDSGSLTLNIANSGDNADNEQAKTILAGNEEVIFSVDVKSTNEEIDLERIAFNITATGSASDLRDSISSATLYLGNDEVATTSNSKISFSGDVVTISFEDMTNTIIPTVSDELRLAITTETIGYERIGKAIASATVTSVFVDRDYAKGVESNEKIADSLTEDTSTVAKELAIVPMIVTPSVTDRFGTDDINATISIATDAGDNTIASNGDSLVATLSGITLELSSVTVAGDVTLFNGAGDKIGTGSIATTDNTVTISVFSTVTEYISDSENYRIETTAEASYRLAKDGVEYIVDSADYKSRLNNTQDMGSYSKSN